MSSLSVRLCKIRPCVSDEKTPLREVTVEFQDASRDPPKAVQQQKQQTAQVNQPSPTLIKYISFSLTPIVENACLLVMDN